MFGSSWPPVVARRAVMLSGIIYQVRFRLIDWFFWCFNATFSNISAISWRPVLVVEYPGRTTYPRQGTSKLYHLRLRVECTLYCNLQSWARNIAESGVKTPKIKSINNKTLLLNHKRFSHWRWTIPTISTKQSSISNHLSLNAKKNAIYGIINQDLGLEQAHKCRGVKSCDR
jgi:hypothetical protein